MRGMFFLLLYCLGLTLIHDDRKIEAFLPEFTNIKIFQPQWRKHSPCMESMFVDPGRCRPLFAFVRRFRGWASTLRRSNPFLAAALPDRCSRNKDISVSLACFTPLLPTNWG